MTFAIGTYDGPELALVGEIALLKIEGSLVVAAKFCAIETGLGFDWRSFPDARFNILARQRRPDVTPMKDFFGSSAPSEHPGLGANEGHPESRTIA